MVLEKIFEIKMHTKPETNNDKVACKIEEFASLAIEDHDDDPKEQFESYSVGF